MKTGSLNDSRKKLERYCQTLKGMRRVHVSLIKRGHNRSVYLLVVAGKKYVGRVGKKNNDGGSSINNEVRMLKFFENAGITFTPKVLHYNKKLRISIETFVGTHLIHFKTFTPKDIDCFARQLTAIHKLPTKAFRGFCKKEGFPLPKTLSPKANLELFGVRRFAKAIKTCPDKKVLDWISVRLKKNIREVSRSNKQPPAHLIWGDIGDNTQSGKGRVFFIDWEFATLRNSTELAYIKIHSHPSTSTFRTLVFAYAQYSKIPEKILWKEIEDEEKIVRVNDVIWAAMKWGEYASTREEEHYRLLTYKRMKLFEQIKNQTERN
ncbi:MAG: hypothetical protein Q7S52_05890 [bacterium]|nr:hypothetical protein [bacterium]